MKTFKKNFSAFLRNCEHSIGLHPHSKNRWFLLIYHSNWTTTHRKMFNLFRISICFCKFISVLLVCEFYLWSIRHKPLPKLCIPFQQFGIPETQSGRFPWNLNVQQERFDFAISIYTNKWTLLYLHPFLWNSSIVHCIQRFPQVLTHHNRTVNG